MRLSRQDPKHVYFHWFRPQKFFALLRSPDRFIGSKIFLSDFTAFPRCRTIYYRNTGKTARKECKTTCFRKQRLKCLSPRRFEKSLRCSDDLFWLPSSLRTHLSSRGPKMRRKSGLVWPQMNSYTSKTCLLQEAQRD